MDWKLILCMGLAAAGLLFGLSQWLRARRQLERMDRMLDRAIDGSFWRAPSMSPSPPPWSPRCPGSSTAPPPPPGIWRRKEQDRGSDRRRVPPDQDPHRQSAAVRLPCWRRARLTPEQRAQAEALKTQAEKLSFLVDALVKSSPAGQRHPHSVPSTSPHPAPAGWGGPPGAGRRRTAWHFPHCPALGRRGPL